MIATNIKAGDVPVKQCSCCGRILPVTSFYRAVNSRDGYQRRCVDCVSTKFRYGKRGAVQQTLDLTPDVPTVNVNINTVAGTVEAHPSVTGAMKRCSRCGRLLPASQFWRDKSHSDGLASQCVECQYEKKQTRTRHRAINSILSEIPDEALIAELKRRGYSGTLKYVSPQEITL